MTHVVFSFVTCSGILYVKSDHIRALPWVPLLIKAKQTRYVATLQPTSLRTYLSCQLCSVVPQSLAFTLRHLCSMTDACHIEYTVLACPQGPRWPKSQGIGLYLSSPLIAHPIAAQFGCDNAEWQSGICLDHAPPRPFAMWSWSYSALAAVAA